MADRASAQSCVGCHSSSESLRHDFKLHDLMGDWRSSLSISTLGKSGGSPPDRGGGLGPSLLLVDRRDGNQKNRCTALKSTRRAHAQFQTPMQALSRLPGVRPPCDEVGARQGPTTKCKRHRHSTAEPKQLTRD
jgi:hypothetical protein